MKVHPLLKPRSQEFKTLVQRIQNIFDESTLNVITLGAMDRNQADNIVAKISGQPASIVKLIPRADLIQQLVSNFFIHEEVQFSFIKALDKSTKSERALVTSIETEKLLPKLGTLRVLGLKRHGAKLIWAMARDPRATVWQQVEKLARSYCDQIKRFDQVRQAAEQKGAAEVLAEFEALYQHTADQVRSLERENALIEKERAHLIAQIGRREAELRREISLRKNLAKTTIQLEYTPRVMEPSPPSPNTQQFTTTSLQKKLRRLDKKYVAAQHENQRLQEKLEQLIDVDVENQRLKKTIQRLRQDKQQNGRASTRSMSISTSVNTLSPLIKPPPTLKSTTKTVSKLARVGLYLDIANLAGTARLLYERSVNYDYLLKTAVNGRKLVEAKAFSIDKGSTGYINFSHSLRQMGYKIYTKKPKIFPDGSLKANWDVGISVEILNALDRIDVVILGSGDGDFVPLVNAIRAKGLRVELVSFLERTAKELKSSVDEFNELNKFFLNSD